MNRIIVYPHEFQKASELELKADDYRFRHIKEVLDPKENQPVKLCLLDQGLANGKITHFTNKKIVIKINKKEPGLRANFTLFVGLSRPPTCKKILEHGTSLGVKRFVFFKSELSDKSYLQSSLWRDEAYKHFLHLGLSQSACFYREPEVEILSRPLYLDCLQEDKLYVAFDRDSDETLQDVCSPDVKDANFFIGPERGWTNKEIKKFKERNVQFLKLSPSTLRVEIATFAALSQASLLMPGVFND